MLDSSHLSQSQATEVAKAIFVSHFLPSPLGNGGNHRAYQILHDLEWFFGVANVVTVSWPEWYHSNLDLPTDHASLTVHRPFPAARRIGRKIPPLRWAVQLWRWTGIRPRLRQLRQRMPFLTVQHPVDLLIGQGYTTRRFSEPEFLAHYRETIKKLEGTSICVIEHPGFSGVLSINRQSGIPTVVCPQNIESFDTAAPFQPHLARPIQLAALDFADEFRMLTQCDARLLISKVEAGLYGGLGAPSHYYPYLPVGDIRCALETIRISRSQGDIAPGLFLLMGTADHTTTGQAFRWFLQQAIAHGLPEGARIVVCGSGTDTLLSDGTTIPGLELRGWVEQSELHDLLCCAQAVLIPHSVGFGAITRVPEMSMAGVPVIMSQHPAYSMDLPPGVTIVEDYWDDWKAAMSEHMQAGSSLDTAYYEWERGQVNALHVVVKRLLDGSRDTYSEPAHPEEAYALSNAG